MKTTILSLTFTSMFALFGARIGNAQSTAFTHQGVVTEYGNFANGIYDFQFALYDAPVLSNQIGAPLERADVQVVDGLLAVSLDFGAVAFNGQRRWVEMRVRPGASTGAYTTFTPRQELAPTPYALYAYKAASVVSNQVVKSVNSLKDDVTLVAGANLTINTVSNSIVISAVGGAPAGFREFTTPGTSQFIVPEGVSRLLVEVWGAGGGGGPYWTSGGSGGGAGGYSRSALSVISGQSYLVVVGQGGGGGNNQGALANGAAGGSSSFQTPAGSVMVTANGGGGGHLGDSNPAPGGAGGTGDPNAGLQRNGGGGGVGTRGTTLIGGSGGRPPVGTVEPLGVTGGAGGTSGPSGFVGGSGYVLITW